MEELDELQLIDGMHRLAAAADPDAVSRRALSGALKVRPHARTFALRWAAIATVLLASLSAFDYFVPAAGLTLADAAVTNPFLHSVGLGNLGDRVTALHDASTQRGITVDLIGGYADGARTVLLLKVPPGMQIDSISVRDQFLQTYRGQAIIGDLSTGDTGVILGPLRGPAVAAGARLAVTIDQLDSVPGGSHVVGHWALNGVLVQDTEHRVVSAAQDGVVGGVRVHVDPMLQVPDGVEIRVVFPGADPQRILGIFQDGSPKGRPAVILRLVGGGGSQPGTPFVSQYVLTNQGPAFDSLWVTGPGPYTLTVDYLGNQVSWPVSLPA